MLDLKTVYYKVVTDSVFVVLCCVSPNKFSLEQNK